MGFTWVYLFYTLYINQVHKRFQAATPPVIVELLNHTITTLGFYGTRCVFSFISLSPGPSGSRTPEVKALGQTRTGTTQDKCVVIVFCVEDRDLLELSK